MARRSDGERRREALLDAALEVASRDGVVGLSVDAVRREAQASPSSIYHLFEDKGALLLALLVRTFERLFTELTAAVVVEATARGAVMALVRGHVAWVRARPREARFMYQAMSLELSPTHQQALADAKATQMAALVAHLGSFIARGQIALRPPLELEVLMLGATHEACRRLLGGAPLDPRLLDELLPELAWQAVCVDRRQGSSTTSRSLHPTVARHTPPAPRDPRGGAGRRPAR